MMIKSVIFWSLLLGTIVAGFVPSVLKCRSTCLEYTSERDFIDAEILMHQSICTPIRNQIATSHRAKSYKELCLSIDLFPPLTTTDYHMLNHPEQDPPLQIVKVIQWRKKEGDTIRRGDTLVLLQGLDDSVGASHTFPIIKEVIAEQDGVLLKILKAAQDQIVYLDSFSAKMKLRSSPLAIIEPQSFIDIDIDRNTKMDIEVQKEMFDRKRQQKARHKEKQNKAILQQQEQEQADELLRWKAIAEQKSKEALQFLESEQDARQTELVSNFFTYLQAGFNSGRPN